MSAAGLRASRPPRRAGAVDVVVAAAVATVAVVGVWAELSGAASPPPFALGAYAIAVAAGAALLLRRRSPLVCAVLVLVLVAGYHLAGYPGAAPAIALFVALYSMAAHASGRWWMTGLAVLFVAVWMLIPAVSPHPVAWYSYAVAGPAMGLVCAIAVGVAARQSRDAAARALREAQETARAQTAERLARERIDLARDVHDVLAHTLSAIAVQSAVALDAFDADPAASRDAMRQVRTLAVRSMPELRRTVTALRGDGPHDAPGPQPGLADLDALVVTARRSGLRVTAVVLTADEARCVDAVTGLCAYRVVQEALTNVVRHAHAAHVDVSARLTAGELRIEVIDDGVGAGVPTAGALTGGAPTAGGFGIRGMRERVSAVGGTFAAGPWPSGGYAVRAVLPIAGERP